MDLSIHRRLREILGPTGLLTSPEDLHPYYRDASGITSRPSAALFPKNTSQIHQIVQLAHEERLPITIRGGGNGLDGGAVAKKDGILLCLEKMNRIVEVSPEDMLAVVQPGVSVWQLNKHLEPDGLFYPVDPASWRSSTIGGDVATRAHGLRTIKYGPIGKYLLGLEAVISPGDIINCGARTLKCATGYHLVDLFTGSAGRIGIITKIILRLLPKTYDRNIVVGSLKGLDEAIQLKKTLVKIGIWPARLELVDPVATRLGFKELVPNDHQDRFLLIMELDGSQRIVKEELGRARGLLERQNNILASATERDDLYDKWWRAREQLLSRLLAHRIPAILLTIVLPSSQLISFFQDWKKIKQSTSCDAVFYGHLGEDRWHLIVLSRGENGKAAEALLPISRAIQDLTISFHGQFLRPYALGFTPQTSLVIRQNSGQERIWRALKTRFDPLDIFHPLD